VTELLKSNDRIRYVLFVRSENEEWLQQISLTDRCRLQVADVAHYSFAEQTRFPLIIRRSGIDLLFSPHFNVPLFCPVPFVATVHDLILHRYPSRSLLKQLAYKMQMRSTVRRAKAMCAVSSFAALEIGGMYGPQAFAKCTVTGEGVDDAFTPVSTDVVATALQKYGLHQPFFLYVGSEKKHKNVALLIHSFLDLHDDQRQLVLVTPHAKQQSPLVHNVIRFSGVPEEDLPALYTAAECFVTASLYEGYCLPVAEALSCGCPVIAIHRTAIPETACGAGMLVEPVSKAITGAMRQPPKRPVLYGRPQWRSAAKITASVLMEVLEKP
jgi:glycosyltransferase involved in cell wall biosynthesis